ncbi:hypothetical protein BSKO_06659 [Bryopsis sp. KO-2023]|nr:hypothetical protein BSKO_06659 [Bryopsis sp. KO-2023]
MSQAQLSLSQRSACSSIDRRLPTTTSSSRQLRVPGGLGVARRVTQKHTRNSYYGEADPLLRRPSAPKPVSDEEDIFGEFVDTDAPLPVSDDFTGITLEFQRQQAKALIAYFDDQEFEKVEQKRFFGWTPENEIGNGRWVMFGILVGFITEYATGVSFWDQLKLMVTYLGIADIYEY